MTPLYRVLFLFELLVCYSSAVAALSLGLIFLPSQLVLLIHGDGSTLWVLETLGGVAGLTALFFVARKIIDPSEYTPPTVLLWLLIAMGALTLTVLLAEAARNGLSMIEFLLFGLPILCSAHVIYLGRRTLF